MDNITERTLSKVPEVTLIFWIIKIAATTLGETGGDTVSMSMNLGYLVGTAIFAAIFLVAVAAQIKAKGFHPFLYWTTIIATTTVGTTLADFADRSLGIGYAGGASSTIYLADGVTVHLVSVTWYGISRYHQFSKGRDVLLDDNHVFSDLRDCTRRLDRRHGRTWLRRRCDGIQCPCWHLWLRRTTGQTYLVLCCSGRHLFLRALLGPWSEIFLISRSALVGWH